MTALHTIQSVLARKARAAGTAATYSSALLRYASFLYKNRDSSLIGALDFPGTADSLNWYVYCVGVRVKHFEALRLK